MGVRRRLAVRAEVPLKSSRSRAATAGCGAEQARHKQELRAPQTARLPSRSGATSGGLSYLAILSCSDLAIEVLHHLRQGGLKCVVARFGMKVRPRHLQECQHPEGGFDFVLPLQGHAGRGNRYEASQFFQLGLDQPLPEGAGGKAMVSQYMAPLLLERSNATTSKPPRIWNPMAVKRNPVCSKHLTTSRPLRV